MTDIVESNLGVDSQGCSIKLTRGIKIIVAQINIDPVTLGVGAHTIYVRYQDEDGYWSSTISKMVTVSNSDLEM